MKYYVLTHIHKLAAKVYGTTEYGDIIVKDNKLTLPYSKTITFTYNFETKTWTKIDKSQRILCKKCEPLQYCDLTIFDNELFSIFKQTENKEFTTQSLREFAKNYYRGRREKVCFPIINRGQAWYNLLTSTQQYELREWYEKWLNITDTLTEPVTPRWINGKLSFEEDLV